MTALARKANDVAAVVVRRPDTLDANVSLRRPLDPELDELLKLSIVDLLQPDSEVGHGTRLLAANAMRRARTGLAQRSYHSLPSAKQRDLMKLRAASTLQARCVRFTCVRHDRHCSFSHLHSRKSAEHM